MTDRSYGHSSFAPDADRSVSVEELSHHRNLRLEETIATGGMGEVYRAHDTALGREVAVKVLREELQENPDVCRRFLHEASLAASLEHPNIIPIHSLGWRSGLGPFFTMKIVEGETLLDRLISLRWPLGEPDLDNIIRILIKVCDALALAHSRGIVHGDLKSRNILLGDYGQVYLTDWGNARTFGEGPPLDADGYPTVLGTVGILAPEQAKGLPVDGRTDVFGLGALLYTILSKRPPYHCGGREARIDAAAACRFRPLQQTAPRAPSSLQEISARAMAAAPSDRYPTIEAMREALDRYRRVQVPAPVVHLASGQVLIREGEPGVNVYLVEEGRLAVTQRADGMSRELTQLGPGAVFGEIAALTRSPRTATVTALTECRVFEIAPERLQEELDRVSPWMRALVRTLAQVAHTEATGGS